MADWRLLQRLTDTSLKHSACVEMLGELTDEDSYELFQAVMQRFIDLTDEMVSIGIQLNDYDGRLRKMHQSMNVATPELDTYINENGVDIEVFNTVLSLRITMLEIINNRVAAALRPQDPDPGYTGYNIFGDDDDDDGF